MAQTAKQKAASRKNIKKAQAARRRQLRGPVRKKRRAARKAPRRRRRLNENAWFNDAAGHSRASKKGWRKASPAKKARRRAVSRRNLEKARRVRRRRGAARRRTPRITRMASPVRRSRRRRRANPIVVAPLAANPVKRTRRRRSSRRSYALNPRNLVANQRPFTRANLMSFGVAAAGAGLGLVFADFLDRWIATRRPADSGTTTANHPWYGRNAAAAQRRRPDAMRLGGQAAGAVGAMGLGYMLRGRPFFPWLLGGIALGFGSNLVKQLLDWWLMPALFKVDNVNEASFSNRMYPLEQALVQDGVEAQFENWASVTALNENQLTTPVIYGPLPAQGPAPGVYALGKAGQPRQVGTGEVGNCYGCGPKSYRPPTAKPRCRYTVKAGDSLSAILTATGVSEQAVNALNGGSPAAYWVVGNQVVLPYEACIYLDGGLTATPAFPVGPAPTATFTPGFRETFTEIPGGPTVINVGPVAGPPQPNGEAPTPPAPSTGRRAMLSFGSED